MVWLLLGAGQGIGWCLEALLASLPVRCQEHSNYDGQKCLPPGTVQCPWRAKPPWLRATALHGQECKVLTVSHGSFCTLHTNGLVPRQVGVQSTLTLPPPLFSRIVSKAQSTFEWMLTILPVSSFDRYLKEFSFYTTSTIPQCVLQGLHPCYTSSSFSALRFKVRALGMLGKSSDTVLHS